MRGRKPQGRPLSIEAPKDEPLLPKLLRQEGLPAPDTEYVFHPTRRWRFDFAWPLHRVALEVEGGIWTKGRHVRGVGYLRDMEKYNAAAVLGWRLIRVTPDQRDQLSTVSLIRDALGLTQDGAA